MSIVTDLLKEFGEINETCKSKKMCRNVYKNGECKYGDKCRFSHERALKNRKIDEDVKKYNELLSKKNKPCKDFIKSWGYKCPNGTKCKYSHELARKEIKKIELIREDQCKFNSIFENYHVVITYDETRTHYDVYTGKESGKDYNNNKKEYIDVPYELKRSDVCCGDGEIINYPWLSKYFKEHVSDYYEQIDREITSVDLVCKVTTEIDELFDESEKLKTLQ